MELYDEELDAETYRAGIHTLAPLEAVAAGPEGMLDRVEEAVADVTRDGKDSRHAGRRAQRNAGSRKGRQRNVIRSSPCCTWTPMPT